MSERQSAFLMSQVTCALIEMEGMKVENKKRELRGESLAYDEKAFMALIDKYTIGWNAAITMLDEGR